MIVAGPAPDCKGGAAVEAGGERALSHLVVWAGGAALWTVHAVWLWLDTRPPVWDMALHQAYATRFLPGYPVPPGSSPWEYAGNYPPLVHLLVAISFFLFGSGPRAAALANLPATFLLLWSVRELGARVAGAAAGRWACILLLLTPYMIWMSRETVLDYWLSAWVAAAWVILLRTRGFESGPWSRLLGLICAAGLLTKWLFAAYITAPFLFIALRHRIWRDEARLAHAADSIVICAAMAGIWYLPNLPRLVPYFAENARIGALEGEPAVLSWQSAIYYLRLLEGYQLFALLFGLLVAGSVYVLVRRAFREPLFWAAAIAGGWVAMTLLRTKDPRFTMPLLGPLAIASGAWLASWGRTRPGRLLRIAFLFLLGIQAYAANFGIRWLPREVVLVRGYQGSFRWDWNLYAQHYFDLLGAPKRENWRQDEILDRVRSDAALRGAAPSLALVPDLSRFNASNFLLAAQFQKVSIRVDQVKAAAGLRSFDGFDYVIMTEREQGMPWTTGAAAALNKLIVDHHKVFRLMEVYTLPNGDAARLYFIDRAAAPNREGIG